MRQVMCCVVTAMVGAALASCGLVLQSPGLLGASAVLLVSSALWLVAIEIGDARVDPRRDPGPTLAEQAEAWLAEQEQTDRKEGNDDA